METCTLVMPFTNHSITQMRLNLDSCWSNSHPCCNPEFSLNRPISINCHVLSFRSLIRTRVTGSFWDRTVRAGIVHPTDSRVTRFKSELKTYGARLFWGGGMAFILENYWLLCGSQTCESLDEAKWFAVSCHGEIRHIIFSLPCWMNGYRRCSKGMDILRSHVK